MAQRHFCYGCPHRCPVPLWTQRQYRVLQGIIKNSPVKKDVEMAHNMLVGNMVQIWCFIGGMENYPVSPFNKKPPPPKWIQAPACIKIYKSS